MYLWSRNIMHQDVRLARAEWPHRSRRRNREELHAGAALHLRRKGNSAACAVSAPRPHGGTPHRLPRRLRAVARGVTPSFLLATAVRDVLSAALIIQKRLTAYSAAGESAISRREPSSGRALRGHSRRTKAVASLAGTRARGFIEVKALLVFGRRPPRNAAAALFRRVRGRGVTVPAQHLPYGVRRVGAGGHVVVAIGDRVLDLAAFAAEEPGLLDGALDGAVAAQVFASGSLNAFLKLGQDVWRRTRAVLLDALSEKPAIFTRLRDDAAMQARALMASSDVEMMLPVEVGDYTDFYSCRQHATNVGTMFRGKDKALLENWTSLPVAYHGRASSVVASGTGIRRPCGQLKPGDGAATFGACRLLDFELEMAAVIGGAGNELGERVAVGDAGNHVFGLALMNDWSARDIQKWEYVPLGPFGTFFFPRCDGGGVVVGGRVMARGCVRVRERENGALIGC